MSKREKQIEYSKILSKLHKNCRFKGCLFPDNSACSSKVIKAHSIQKSKILNYIAENGMLTFADVRKIFDTNEFEEVGVNSASTFFGFCSFHDTSIFSEIENNDYIENQEQNFLYAYRACALEFVKKQESSCFHQNLRKFVTLPNQDLILKNVQKGLEDLTDILDFFSNELIKIRNERDFNIINTKIFKLSYESLIAVNSIFNLKYDFKGKRINDLTDFSKRPSPLFLNVFPQNGKTIILLSWLSIDTEIYHDILVQLESYKNLEVEKFFSNLIITECENFYISPIKYKSIPAKIRKLLVSKFIETTASPRNQDYLSENPPVNLFRVLEN